MKEEDGGKPAAEDGAGMFPAHMLALPEGVPPLPEDGNFTMADHWAWASIVSAGIADFHSFFSPDEPGEEMEAYELRYRTGPGARVTASDEHLPDEETGHDGGDEDEDDGGEELDEIWADRTLSDDFLNTILCREPWRSAIPFSQIDITGARLRVFFDRPVSHSLILDNCLVHDSIAGFGCQFERNVLLRNTTVFGLINFGDAQFGQAVRLMGVWASQCDFSDARIDGSLWISDCIFERDCDLIGARISGLLTLAGSAFHGKVEADRIEIGASLLMRNLPHVGDIDLVNASIAGSLDLSGSRFTRLCDLTNARIGRELRLSSAQHPSPVWGPDARLILRNAETAALQSDLSGILKESARQRRRLRKSDFVPTDLSGFRFEMFGGRHAGGSDTLSDAPVRLLCHWIESMPRFHERYTPAPYRRFAGVLKAEGHADKAASLMVAKSRHRIRARNTGLFTRMILSLGGLLSGFGQRNHRAVFWFFLLVVAGMFTGLWAEGWRPGAEAALPSSWDDWLRASFDNAAPIIEFQDGSAATPQDLLAGTPPGWFQGTWFTFACLGFVVLSYLLAGISGVFDKGEG